MFVPLPMDWIRKAHKKFARHHNMRTRKDYIEAIIDFDVQQFKDDPDYPGGAVEILEQVKHMKTIEEYTKFRSVMADLSYISKKSVDKYIKVW